MIVILMGVSGAGKTTVGRRLAARLDAEYLEGDSFHPAANVAKMRRGEPLDDRDRAPWLAHLNALLRDAEGDGRSVVLACSALRRGYRETLIAGLAEVRMLHLQGPRELIAGRLAERRDHYMPETLLDSQFATLEPPAAEEGVASISIAADPESVVEAAMMALSAQPRPQ